MKVKDKKFVDNFLNSVLVRTACMTLPFKHKWNNLCFTDKLVYLRNKAIQKRVDLTVEK